MLNRELAKCCLTTLMTHHPDLTEIRFGRALPPATAFSAWFVTTSAIYDTLLDDLFAMGLSGELKRVSAFAGDRRQWMVVVTVPADWQPDRANPGFPL